MLVSLLYDFSLTTCVDFVESKMIVDGHPITFISVTLRDKSWEMGLYLRFNRCLLSVHNIDFLPTVFCKVYQITGKARPGLIYRPNPQLSTDRLQA